MLCVSASTIKLCVLIPFNIIKRRITSYTHPSGGCLVQGSYIFFQGKKNYVKDLKVQWEITSQNDERYLSHIAPKGKGKQHLCHLELEEQDTPHL